LLDIFPETFVFACFKSRNRDDKNKKSQHEGEHIGKGQFPLFFVVVGVDLGSRVQAHSSASLKIISTLSWGFRPLAKASPQPETFSFSGVISFARK
jgi:hypothetical protein